jgi:hypothetical protein
MIGDAVTAEFKADRGNISGDIIDDNDNAFEPAKQAVRLSNLRLELAKLIKPAVAHHIDSKLGSIRGDTDETMTGLCLALRQIATQLRLGVGALACQVPLDLEDCAAKQRVDTTAYLWHRAFEINPRGISAQAIGEQLIQQRSDLFVAGLCDKFGDDLFEFFLFHDLAAKWFRFVIIPRESSLRR